MADRPPPKDWASDFDHLDERWVGDPFPIWDDLRARCPVAHTDRYGGVYFPSRHDDMRAIALDTEHFSSRRVVVRAHARPLLPSPPITSDPPEHGPFRRLLSPYFAPGAVARLEPRTRAVCAELVDRVIARGRCDAAAEYAQHVPARVIATMLGIPEADADRFRDWILRIQRAGITDDAALARALLEMNAYFRGQVARRRADPGDDLVSALLAARLDGAPLKEQHLLGMLRLVLIAGIDTTWSAIGASLWHLATHADDRARLAADPALLPTAVEELLRAYAPGTMAREVARDVEVGGCKLKAGEMVLLPFPAANRDPAIFPDPSRVVIDRADNPHTTFGLGIHRCLGADLARMELRVALEEWLRRIPEFALEETPAVTWSAGTVRGPQCVPVAFAH